MSRVDFYVLAQAGEHARHAFACRLAEKAYRLDNRVHIHANSRADAERLDELLWTFRDGSFVPHHLLGTAKAELPSPVTVGFDELLADGRDLLINLCDEVPAFAEGFERIAELVTSDEDCKLKSRRRFVQYRDNGHTLGTHNV